MGEVQIRSALLKRAENLEVFTLSYNVLEGIIAVTAGLLAGSAALTGFGLDSIVETTSAAVLWWRLRTERQGRTSGVAIERTASRIAGALLLLLAVIIAMEAGRQLITGSEPDPSLVGIALTGLSLMVMPVLARAKLRLAARLQSRALRADAYETIACAWLSGTTLAGLTLNAALGWWWADPVAALVLVPLIAREGWEAWREAGEEEDDD